MDGKPINILLVEDNPGDARLVSEMMGVVRDFSFDLSYADTLATGLECLARGGVDVVLLDLLLPDCQGFDTLARVQDQAPEVPIVVMTALNDEMLAIEAVGKGAQDYLVKGEISGNLLARSLSYAIERKRADGKLLLFQHLINQSSDAIFVIDPETDLFEYVDDIACSSLGYTREELLKMGVVDIAPEVVPDSPSWKKLVKQVQKKGHMLLEGNLTRKDGSVFPVEVNVRYVTEENKGYMIAVARNIIDHKRAEEELRKLNETLEQRVAERTAELTKTRESLSKAQRIARLGNWDWNIATNELWWSDEIYRIFGLTNQQFSAAYEDFLDLVHPDDKGYVMKSVEEALHENKPYSIYHRVVHPDGTERIVHEMAEVFFDDDGKPCRMIGTAQDVTERKLVESEVAERAKRLHKLSELSMTLTGNPVDVFKKVVRIIGELLDAPVVCLSEIRGNELHFLSVYIDGEVTVDAGRCPLSVTPCATVDEAKDVRFYDQVIEKFPKASFLKKHNAFSYCGFPSLDAAGNVVGVTCLLDDKPHDFSDEDKELMQIFGQRIGLEIERQRHLNEHKKVEEKMEMANKVFETAVEGVTVTDPKGNILFVNPAFTLITGYSAEEAIGNNPRILKSDRHDVEFYANMWNCLLKHGHWEGEIWNRRKSGEAYPEWLSITAVKDSDGNTTQYVAVFHDITEVKRTQEKIEHQAYHDALTGLPNRQLLYDRLTVALKHAQRHNQKMSILFVDLDDFKKINDSLGHIVGDIMLQGVTERLLNCCREEDTVARVGGDEFVIFLPEIDTVEDPIEIAKRIIKSLADPFPIGGNDLFIGTTIGISVYPFDGDDAGILIKNADMAMYRAKETGKNKYQLFTPAMNEAAVKRLEMENSLRKAWGRNEFFPYYQPKVSLNGGKIVGIEALLRWQRPGGDFISPAEFLPTAERIGLITSIDEWVLREACKYVRRIHEAGFEDLSVSVNLSAKNFDQGDLVAIIRKTIEEIGILPKYVELEVTESMLIQNINTTVKALHEMRSLGLCVAVDDFGTGYSSLNYLKRFPITTLKIDKSFVDDLSTDPKSRAIAKAIVSMSHDMGIKVLAEGVETQEQLDHLYNIGCDEIQGYIFSPPVPTDKLEVMLQDGKSLSDLLKSQR